ncbi:sensor histidine kinase [Actinoplanes sp. RD1]|uniref:sensor histidine kinase n=1 Tax=Actinoplanes sp. RD1 TaxID=3064538 RepID=UPI00274087B0|nr:histidine kinase [Actinoplanes sp. RD1]
MEERARRTWAAAIGLTILVVAAAVTAPPGRVRLDLVSSFLLVVPALATAVRRRAPLAVLGLATACMLGYQLRGYPGVAPALVVMVALHAAVRARHRWPAGAAAGLVLIGGVAGELAGPGGRPQEALQRWLLLAGWLVAAGVAGELSRQRAAQVARLEQRARDEERLRIARELHDSLTHSISLIKVRAGVAVHLARKRGEPVPESLLAIEQAGREAMASLRAALEVLSDPGEIDELVAAARDAGVPVTLTVTGSPWALPGPVRHTAYRLVQEALTNVTRHAGAATVTVRLAYKPGALDVHVENDGPGAPDLPGEDDAPGAPDLLGGNDAPGRGLTGMRDRVAAVGGSLRIGHRTGGGYRVHATLPREVPA